MAGLAVKDIEPTKVNPRTRDGRASLAKMVMKLFDLWKLNPQEQMGLLGLAEGSRMSLTRYRKGDPLADNRDLLDRAANLLSIHRSLRILFPQNRELVYTWPTAPNRSFEGHSPVDIIRRDGFLGLLIVKQYLDFERGQ